MILTSPKNNWVRQIRRLHLAKGRREQGTFLVEGTHLIQEALKTDWPLQAICYTPHWQEHNCDLLHHVPATVRQQLVSEDVLARLATTETPDGVIAVAQHIHSSAEPTLALGIAVETLRDPANLGALIRTSVAAGSDAFWISRDSVDPEHPKVLRASAGQWFRRPPASVEDLPELILRCQQKGVQVLAACARSHQKKQGSLWEWDLTLPTLFLLGNEGAGLNHRLVDLADGTIQIPMADGVESLNLAMSGGLLLYEAKRQRQLLRPSPRS